MTERNTHDIRAERAVRASRAIAANAEGTARFASRFGTLSDAKFFREAVRSLRVSSLGIGTYLGEATDSDDALYAAALDAAVSMGINLIDTAINYRCQRAERTIGAALQRAFEKGVVARDEVVIATKGGYIPMDSEPFARRKDYDAYLKREFFDAGVMAPNDVIGAGHSLAPGFLRWSLERSRRNLGVGTIDLYMLHNPEQQAAELSPSAFRELMRASFMVLEGAVTRGEIGAYGCATWSGLRVAPGSRGHLVLHELVALARDVAGDSHHFKAIQLPVSLAMPEAFRVPTQPLPNDRMVTAIEAAQELGLSVFASAPLMQSQLTHGLPDEIRGLVPAARTDAECALAIVRGMPGVTSALVGMRSAAHVSENIAGALHCA